jgi:hypothetical protein
LVGVIYLSPRGWISIDPLGVRLGGTTVNNQPKGGKNKKKKKTFFGRKIFDFSTGLLMFLINFPVFKIIGVVDDGC